MLFNSIHFCFFLPIVIIFYYLLPFQHRWKLLLPASYYFYMCWKPEYAFLLLISTVIDFYVGNELEKQDHPTIRRLLLAFSLSTNLGMLFFFKYFNFFNENAGYILGKFNIFYQAPELKILLPVGISFYTFQAISYTIDVYYRRAPAERHFGYFALYITYFPQLVAGPIERVTSLMPQLKKKFEYSENNIMAGLIEVGWGMFKKVVIADRLAPYTDFVFNNPSDKYGGQIIIAVVLFTYQIYCDFSGYTDIATGSARMMGVKLMTNFNNPFWSKSVTEYWRRWHISLSNWLRDYVYFPMGGSRCPNWRVNFNVIATMFISGLWHGASWNFVFWGGINGGLMAFERSAKQNAKWAKLAHHTPAFVKMILVFFVICLTRVFFRAKNFDDSMIMLTNIFYFDRTPDALLRSFMVDKAEFKLGILFIIIMEIICVKKADLKFGDYVLTLSRPVRILTYYLLAFLIIFYGVFTQNAFIYFQF